MITINWHHSLLLLRGEEIFLSELRDQSGTHCILLYQAFLKGKRLPYKFPQIYCKMWMKKCQIKEIKYFTIVSVRTFVILFYYGSGSAKVRN